MTEPDSTLTDTFGEEFAEGVQEQIQRRRREREQVSDEVVATICDLAINEGQLDSENPHFQYTTEAGTTHDILLMQVPQPERSEIWEYMNELDSGAVTIPLDYLGEWMSCLFNDKQEVAKLEQGNWYLVIGELGQWETDEGESRDQMSPVRGVVSVKDAKAIASGELEAEGFGSPDEVEEETSDSSEEEEEDTASAVEESGLFDDESSDDEEEEVEEEEDDDDGYTAEDVSEHVDDLGEAEEEVWDVTDTDDDRHLMLGEAIAGRMELDHTDDEVVSELGEAAVEYIVSQQEEDDEEEEEEAEESLFG